MAQGLKRLGSRGGQVSKSKSATAKAAKQKVRDQKIRKGNPTQLPKKRTGDILDDIALTKAIDKSNTEKVAAKLIQDGGRVSLLDIMKGGKDINREKRRDQVKKKLTRVEDKLKQLREKAESEGKL